MTHDWQRYWTAPDAAISLADQGFLVEPAERLLGPTNPALRTFQQITEYPCLILLGEPGMGKTKTLEAESARVAAACSGTDDEVLRVDLGSTRHEPTLRQEIFGAAVERWREGNGTLHMFLDSLDEAVLRLGVVGDILLAGLRADGIDVSRLRLRLTCRTADRLRNLEEGLRAVWRRDAFGVFELAPLTRAAVRLAAEDRDLDPGAFVAELVDRDIVPLAIKPLTLNFLLDAAASGGGLPSSQLGLYDRGLRTLVTEPERRRRDPRTRGEVDVGRRMAIASRIAAGTILTGRPNILADSAAELGTDYVLLRQLAGGQEEDQDLAATTRFDVTTPGVEEVLDSGLFSARGDDLGWAHQTYGEFLAARYLLRNRLAKDDVLSLLISSGDPARRIAPQLRDVAAWAAAMDGALFDELASRDPLVLLRGDVELADNDQRARLTTALLSLDVAEELDKWDPRVRRNLRQITHTGLADTLRACLTDSSSPPAVRALAGEIAALAGIDELQAVLADLALDASEPNRLRVDAVRALAEIANDETRARILPLARDPLPEDTDDDLKGSALRCVCPGILVPRDAFGALTPEKQEHYFGPYASFLMRDLPNSLAIEDLPAALAWVQRLPREHHPLDELSGLAEAILVRAWAEMDAPEVLAALADAVISFLDGPFDLQTFRTRQNDEAFQAEAGRRRLVEALLPAITEDRLNPWSVAVSRPRLLTGGDVPWLAARLEEEVGTEREQAWAELLDEASYFQGADLDVVLEARFRSNAFRDLTNHRLGSIELHSEQAAAMREGQRKWDERAAEERGEQESAPDMDARIDRLLDQFERGELDAFWQLNRDLSVEQGRRHYSALGSDLTSAPGWQRASPERRARIAAAATQYCNDFEPDEDWFDNASIEHYPSLAGYRALCLASEAGALEELDSAVIERWIPAMLAFPLSQSEHDGEEALNERLLATAYAKSPASVIEMVCRRIRAESRHGSGYLSVLSRTTGLIRNDLAATLLRQWREEDLPAQAEEDLLRALLDAEIEGAVEAARERLTLELIDGSDEDANRARRVAAALVSAHMAIDWASLWETITARPDWGALVLETVAGEMDRSRDIRRDLSEWELADLFLWLEERYPRGADSDRTGTRFLGPRDQIADYRNGVLGEIGRRGTDDAIYMLDRIQDATGLELRGLRRRAEEERRTRTWDPPRPEDIIALAQDARRRVIFSEGDLQRVILESLDRAQQKIVEGDAHLLWDTASGQPKGETELASWIASHLRDDLRGRGIIVNREVEVRVNPSGGVGDRTDIHVDAIAGELVEGAERVTVVIEVKGCWNNELRAAMRTQLAEDYLPASGSRHGVFLPIWFTPNSRWTQNWRRDICARVDRASLEAELLDQAETLGGEVGVDIAVLILDGTLREATRSRTGRTTTN